METVAVNKEKKTEEVTIIERLNSQINEERFFKDLSTIQMRPYYCTVSTLAKGISVADSNLQNTAIEIIREDILRAKIKPSQNMLELSILLGEQYETMV